LCNLGTGISTTDELRKRIMHVLGVDADQAADEFPNQAATLPAGINDNPQVQDAVNTLMRSAVSENLFFFLKNLSLNSLSRINRSGYI